MRAAGAVVLRDRDGVVEVLAIHRPRYDDWSLPKGKLDHGELHLDAARREVREETGYDCRLGAELPAVGYRDRFGRAKEVRYWVATVAGDQGFAATDEVDERRWVPARDADALLTYAADRDLVRLATRGVETGSPA